MIRFPDKRFSVAVLSNSYDIPALALADDIARVWLFDEDPVPRQPRPADKEWEALPRVGQDQASDYAGRYHSDEVDADLEITWLQDADQKTGDLAVVTPSGRGMLVRPTRADEMRSARGYPVTARFERDSSGQVTALVFSAQRVENLRYTRV